VPGERFSTKRPDTFTQTVASLNFNLLQSGGGPYIIVNHAEGSALATARC
jgi:hypothetical protein